MVRVYKMHLHKSSLKPIQLNPENVKNIFFVVYKYIKYLLFRFYSTKEMIVKGDKAMRTVRNKRSELEQQFLIPRPVENSWGKSRALDKERIIKEFCEFTPVMNKKGDQECMKKFLAQARVDRVQDPGWTPFGSAPLVDYLAIGIHSGAHTILGIQADCGLSYHMLRDMEVKEIITGKSSPEEILEI